MKNVAIALGILLLTFGIGYLVAVRLLFPPLPEPEVGIAVPDVRGQRVWAADRQLRPLGLVAGDITELAHPTESPGIIIAQSPLPGQQLRSGGTVRFAVSAGAPRAQVPNVTGFDVARALAVLSQLGFSADQRREQSERPAGTVLRTVPAPGQRQRVPARVLIVVSSGPPPPPADTTRSPPRPDSIIQNFNQ